MRSTFALLISLVLSGVAFAQPVAPSAQQQVETIIGKLIVENAQLRETLEHLKAEMAKTKAEPPKSDK